MQRPPPFEAIFRTCKLSESEQQVLLEGVTNAENVRDAVDQWKVKASLVRDALSSNLGGFWNCCCGWEYANNILYASGSYAAVEVKRDGKRTLYVVWRSPGASFLTAGAMSVPEHLARPSSADVNFLQNVSTPMQEVVIVNLFHECVQQQATYTVRAKELKLQLENFWGKPIQVIIGKENTWGATIFPGDLCMELTLTGHKLLVYRHLDQTHLRVAAAPLDSGGGGDHQYARELLDLSPEHAGFQDVDHLVAGLTGLINREFRVSMVIHLILAIITFFMTYWIRAIQGWTCVGLVCGVLFLRTVSLALSLGAFSIRFRVSWSHTLANLVSLATWVLAIYEFLTVGRANLEPFDKSTGIPFIVQMCSFGLAELYWVVISIDSSFRGELRFRLRRYTISRPSSCRTRSYTLNSDQLLKLESRPINDA